VLRCVTEGFSRVRLAAILESDYFRAHGASLGRMLGRIGFVSEPAPNPTTGAVAFRVALPVAGRVSVQVFDVRGKLVAVPLDQDLGAGVFDAGWNGAARSGARAGPGVYHLRLSLPGYQATRRIVLAP